MRELIRLSTGGLGDSRVRSTVQRCLSEGKKYEEKGLVADVCAGAALQKFRSAFLRIIQTQATSDIETIKAAAVRDMLAFLQMIQAKDLQLLRTWAVPMTRVLAGAPGAPKPPSAQSGASSGAADAAGGPTD
jgi:hypothetical protein